MDDLTPYESDQLSAIKKWKQDEPGVVDRAFGIVVQPLTWLVRKLVPEAAVRGALDFANTAGRWLSDSDDIVRNGGVSSIQELAHKDLALCDGLADSVHNWAVGLAVVEGAATGAPGVLGAPVDVPAIITLALRTIHKIGLCYGFQSDSDQDQQFVLGVLAASSANTIEEKVTALATLSTLRTVLVRQTWKAAAERAAAKQFSKEAAVTAVRQLGKQIGVNLTKRRALAAVPVIGALVGGSVNGWYIKEVGWAARRSFQERWLETNGKLE